MKFIQQLFLYAILLMALSLFLLGWSHTAPHWGVLYQALSDPSILDETSLYIVFQMRLPRIVLAYMVGMALALSGLVLQSLFRNPLVDPFIIGVSGGGALGAGIAILFNFQLNFMFLNSTPILSFAMAMLMMKIVYGLGVVQGKINVERLLLAGVAMSSLSSAILSFILVIQGKGMDAVVYWIMGSLSGRTWEEVWLILPFLLLAILGLIFCLKGLHAYQLGEESAIYLGINVDKLKSSVLVSSTLLAAAVVAVSGVIGFIGLIIPHMSRYLYRSTDIRMLFFPTMFMGAVLLASADGLARNLLEFQEIPVGIFTALLGVPFFLYLLLSQRKA